MTKRRRRMVRTLVISGSLALIVAAVIIFRPAPEPYTPGERMEGLTDDLSRSLPRDHPGVTFTDVAADAGISFVHFHGRRSTQLPEDMGSGAAWGDYDGDGWLDLYVVNQYGPLTMTPAEIAASPARNMLFHNRGDGTFEDVTDAAGVGLRTCGMGAAWGDYDGDGRLDLVTTSYGTNTLFRNNGDGTFEDVSGVAGIAGTEGFWAGASWGDYDRDGRLDLYICGYVRYTYDPDAAGRVTPQYATPIPASLNPSTYKPRASLLYHNNGDGTFTEVAEAAGVSNVEGRSLSASWCDVDEDGWPDLYVANDISDNVLYHNRGDGTFEDISHAAWVADYRGAMGLAVGDWDEDDDLDIFVTHWIAQENALYSSMYTDFADAGAARATAVNFTDVSDQVGLGQIALDYIGWGTGFIDVDNNGVLDLVIANGSTFQQDDAEHLLVPMRPLLFWNRGRQDGFFDIGPVSGEVFKHEYVGRGLAIGDFDNDGDGDVFIVVNGGSPLLLRNDRGNANHWLKLRLRGTKSNQFGIGAKIRLSAGGRTAIREMGAGSSYCSQHAAGEELFGLGAMARVDSIVVAWPSGHTQRLRDVDVDQVLTVTEDGSR